MRCNAPPPLNDDQITAALDGSPGPEVQAHLAGCPACAARLERARQVELGLRTRLRRWDCPAPQLLADYHLGLITGEPERSIVRHLAICASCKEELETLRLFLGAEEPRRAAPRPAALPPRATPRGPLFARLLPRAPAIALRGHAAGPLQAVVEDTMILLDTRAAVGKVELQGQIAGDDPDRWAGALVELRQEGALRATAEVDDLGTFSCGLVPLARSELRFTPRAGRMVILPDLDLTA